MKKLIIVIGVLLVGCGPTRRELEERGDVSSGLYTLKYDSCEYVRINIFGAAITHKGNCKNPIHKNGR